MGKTMLVGMHNTRLEGKILTILDFRNDFFPTYLQLCVEGILAFLEKSDFDKCIFIGSTSAVYRESAKFL